MPTTNAPASGGRAPRRRLLLGLLALAALVGAVAATSWWRHPTLFPDMSAGRVTIRPGPQPEDPLYLGLAGALPSQRAEESITLHSARFRLRDDTAAVEARLLVCTRRHADPELAVGSDAGEGSLAAYCTRVRPVRDGARMRVGGGAEYFVASFTASRAGRVRLVAVDVDYTRDGRHLHQSGTQSIAQDVRIGFGG